MLSERCNRNIVARVIDLTSFSAVEYRDGEENMNVRVFVSLAIGALVAEQSFAQVSTGTITGAVLDSSGAAVVGATVQVMNENTAVQITTLTDTSGNYIASRLLPGKYRAEVTMPGFQPQSRVGIVLSIDQTIRVDFSLAAGEQKQVITVMDRAAQMLETSTSSLGEVIEESLIKELPLNGRDFKQLIGLTAGAQPAPSGGFAAGTFNINGTRGEGNAFLVDGLDVSSFSSGDTIRVVPSLEALGEFKIITNSFSAEYGRSFSGVVSVHVKSGTNDFHGSLFHFFRNRVLDARNFFAQQKPQYNFNQFGGSIGGPILRNKLFFFTDYQGTRIRQGSPQLMTLPTVAERNGDFSHLLPGTVIYDPLTNPRAPFPNNRIPLERFDKPSALMFSLLPEPNQAGVFNYFKTVGRVQDQNEVDIRVDYLLDSVNRFAFVHTIRNGDSETLPIFPRLSGHLITPKSRVKPRSYSLNYTRTIGSRGVNELIVGYKRDHFFGPTTEGMQYEPDAGVPYLNTSPDDEFTTGFPMYQIAGYQLFGGPAGGPFEQVHNIPQLTENFSWSAGRHFLKAGFSYRGRQFNLAQSVWPRGQNVFNTLPTSLGSVGGHSVASALLGYPSNVTRNFQPPWGERLKEYGFYFQDDFKVNRRLTLNLGLRYELFPPATESHDRVANFDLKTRTMILAGVNGNSKSLLELDKNNFGPRIGFAYLLTEDGNTVIRGGYGIGYVLLVNAGVGTANTRLTTQQPFTVNFSASGLNYPEVSRRVSDGLPLPAIGDPLRPTGDVVYIPANEPTPYTQMFNLNIQRALPGGFLADVAYAGSRGVHLTGQVNLNQAPPGPTAAAPRSVITPSLNIIQQLSNHQSSTYHSLQTKIQRRFSGGFSLLGSYTFSKSIDNGSYVISSSSSSNAYPQDARNWDVERGLSDFDFAHRLAVSYLYELPVGTGKAFGGSMNPILDAIIGGWQINGITTLQSGQVYTPNVANQRTNAGPGGDIRPHRIGTGELPSDQRTVQRWFDKSAFVVPVFEFGNSGRNILRGPGLVNFDFSTFKDFQFSERIGLQFRAEFFNIFNHANFNNPNRAVDIPAGGTITSARDPRQVQLGLKLLF